MNCLALPCTTSNQGYFGNPSILIRLKFERSRF